MLVQDNDLAWAEKRGQFCQLCHCCEQPEMSMCGQNIESYILQNRHGVLCVYQLQPVATPPQNLPWLRIRSEQNACMVPKPQLRLCKGHTQSVQELLVSSDTIER